MKKSSLYALLIISLLLLLAACKNFTSGSGGDSYSSKPDLAVNTEDTSSFMRFEIYDQICKMKNKALPPVIDMFCDKKEGIKGKIIDNSYMQIVAGEGHNRTELYVKHLKDPAGKNIFFINAIKTDSLKYSNYFYVVKEYKRGKYENITLNVIPDDVVQIISLEMGSLHYVKSGNLWAYSTDTTHTALFFDFHGQQANVYKCLLNLPQSVSDSCSPFLRLFWEGDHFTYNLVNRETEQGLLSQKQLDLARRYTSIEDAINNAKVAYILNVSGQGISYLPEEIGLLKNLQIMVISDNYLDSLPASIGQLVKLQILRADNNRLKTLPPQFGNLVNIEELDLSHNRLEWIPYEFKNLTNLLKLDLSYNNLQLLAYDMTNMDKLAVLNISNNNFEKFPNQIFNLKSLVYLDVSNNPIKILPRSFEKLPNLKYLDIRNTLIDTTQINYFKLKIPNIELIY